MPPSVHQPHADRRHIVVVGLGRTGFSCARFLAARGERVAVTDSRAAPPELGRLTALDAGIEVRVGGFDEQLLEHARQVVISPGVSLKEPFMQRAAERGLEIVGDIELFARAVTGPVVGVTGTNGKSTVTTLIAEMARADGRRVSAGGNLGEPALDLLAGDARELYVLELSSYQLETTRSLEAARGNDPQRDAGSSRSVRERRRVRGGEGPHSRALRCRRVECRRCARDGPRAPRSTHAHVLARAEPACRFRHRCRALE